MSSNLKGSRKVSLSFPIGRTREELVALAKEEKIQVIEKDDSIDYDIQTRWTLSTWHFHVTFKGNVAVEFKCN